jgi:hypothetical protein
VKSLMGEARMVTAISSNRDVMLGKLAPQVLKAAWRELGIAHRRLDASMTKVRLQRACIGALVRPKQTRFWGSSEMVSKQGLKTAMKSIGLLSPFC